MADDAQQHAEFLTALMLIASGSIDEATEALQRLDEELLARPGGRDLPLRAAIVSHLGHCHFLAGDDAEAIRCTEEALRLEELRQGRRGIFHAVANLALARARAGDGHGCARDVERAVELYRNGGSVDDRDDVVKTISYSLHQFGQSARERGDISRAVRLTEHALRLRELLPADRMRRVILNDLASLLMGRSAGDLPRAKQLLDLALSIEQTLHSSDSIEIAATFYNLGNWHYLARDYDRARDFFRQSLAIGKDRDHPVVAAAAVALAGVELGSYEDTAARAALDPIAGAPPASLPDLDFHHVARLVDMYVRMGNPAAGEPFALRLVEMGKERGTDSRWYAYALGRLGELRGVQRRPEARQLLAESLRILQHAPDVNEHGIAAAANNLGRYLVDTECHAEAIPFLEQAAALDRGGDRLHWAADANNLGIAYQAVGRFDEAIALLEEVLAVRRELLPAGNRYIAQTLFNLGGTYLNMGRLDRAIPLLRESVQEEHAAIDRAFAVSTEAERLAYMNEVLDSITTVFALMVPHFGNPEAVALLFEMAVQRKGIVAERIAAEREAGTLASTLREASLEAIAAALPRDSALIEILAFELRYANVQTVGYAAFLLPSGRPEALSMALLGNEEQLEAIVDGTRALMPLRWREEDEAEWREYGNSARSLFFERFGSPIAAFRTLFIAPDGVLHRFPFHALPDRDGRPLFERYEICHLTSGRDLFRIHRPAGTPANAPVVVAAPSFGTGPHRRFADLPATRREGERVASMLGVDPWLDGEASKERVKVCRSPRILHFATHGFYQPEPDGSTTLEEILRRSGVALSGANSDPENGILYAQDVLAMDLAGTELVTLSACETALGDYQRGEGIYGLRRAFFVAGARSLLVSLWSVPDQPTCELMETFYEVLGRGESRIAALRAAQRRVRQTYPSPLCWAAFICIGDPGPLAVVSF